MILVAFELVVGVYAITRIVDAIQFYLVQWISAVGFVVWLAVGNTAYEFAARAGLDGGVAHDLPGGRRSCWSWPCAWLPSGPFPRMPEG